MLHSSLKANRTPGITRKELKSETPPQTSHKPPPWMLGAVLLTLFKKDVKGLPGAAGRTSTGTQRLLLRNEKNKCLSLEKRWFRVETEEYTSSPYKLEIAWRGWTQSYCSRSVPTQELHSTTWNYKAVSLQQTSASSFCLMHTLPQDIAGTEKYYNSAKSQSDKCLGENPVKGY